MLPFCHRVIQPVMAIVIPLTIFHIATKGLVSKGWNVVKFHQSVLYLWRDGGHKSVLAGRKYDSITKMSGSRA